MKKSRIVSLVMAVTTVFSTATPVFANDLVTSNYDYSVMPISEVYEDRGPILISPRPATQEIKVLLNDEEIDFTDENGNKVTPQLINDRTMVPMRKIFEVFDAEIDWDGATETVTATTEEKVLKLQINNEKAIVTEGEEIEEITLDSVPVVIDGRTLVPVRFISETLGLKVGWDEATQTVIIIDPSFVLDVIKEDAPIFYELITSDYETPKTSETKMTLNGNVNYTNAEEKSSNTNIKLALTGTSKLNQDAVSVDIDSKVTGKGILYDAIKEEGFEKVTLSAIFDMKNFAYYMKSSLLEEEIGKKWIKETLADVEEIEAVIDMKALETAEEVELEDLVNVLFDYVEIDKNTYAGTKLLTKILCQFVNDDHFTVSGRTTKTYTYEITASDINEIFKNIGIGAVLPEEVIKEAKLKFTMKFKDNMNTEASATFEGEFEYMEEKLDVNFSTKATLTSANKTVTIKMPAEKDVYRIEDDPIVNETINNAQLANFSNDLAEVQQMFDICCITKYGNMKAEGSNVNRKQVFNYMARGGDFANIQFVSLKDAELINCTKIEEKYARKVFDIDLPEILVKDKNGKEIKASYYATSEGNVFIWPPFRGSYVAHNNTLEFDNASEIFENGYKFMVGKVEIEVGKDIK